MSSSLRPSPAGAFVQLIEFRTDHPEQMQVAVDEWIAAIGAERTARSYVTAADRDQPRSFVQLVEFPSYESAMANSGHPATTRFAAALSAMCNGDVAFRNLDVLAAATL